MQIKLHPNVPAKVLSLEILGDLKQIPQRLAKGSPKLKIRMDM